MNFYCDSSGQLLHVDPERVYQGSAMANTIRFIGAFPQTARVTVAYQLPNGIWTTPQLMTANATLSGVQDNSGVTYSVWESKLGVKYEVQNGQTVAVPDYRITANYGTVLVQFYVYAGNGESAGTKLATASSSFVVEKGVPVNIPDEPTDDYAALLQQILSSLQTLDQSVLSTSIAANTNVLLAHNGTMYLYLNPHLTAEDIYMKLLPNAVEIDTNEGGVLLYGKNTGEWKRYFWSEITALFPDKVKTSPDGTTDCLYFDTSDILVYDATDNTFKIVQVGDFNSLTQIALFGHYYGNITGKLVEANARNLQYMVNDFFMQDETATVLTFEFGEEGGSVTLDLANTQYSSVYFDQYARIPTAGRTTVKCPFSSGRHYVTLINNTALSGVNDLSFITVGKENLIAVKISTLVNDIGAYAFDGCTALRKLEIPLSASGEQRRIADCAFYDCPLEELKIPEGFTEVGYDCFNEVRAKEIELPTSLNAFAGFAFNSSYIEKIICKNANPVWTTPEEEQPFNTALLIVPHDSVETYKSVFGYDKVEAYAYVGEDKKTVAELTKWKLLGETEITQAMIDAAGANGINGVVIDLGAPIEKWYGETWVRAEFGQSADLNSADYGVVCGFGRTETEATSSGDAPCHICKSQTGTYAPMYRNQKNVINLFTNWYENLPKGTLVQVNGYSAWNYPQNAFATSNNTDTTIIGNRYMGLTGYNRSFKFPVGTKLKLYGRF